MKRLFFLLLLIFTVSHFSPIYAQPSPTPTGGVTTLLDGHLLPGVTCGIAGDPDPGKAKCCVPKKKDNSFFTKVLRFADGVIILGDFISGIEEKYTAIEGLSQTMDPCSSGIPSTKDDLSNKSCICITDPSPEAVPELNDFCVKYFPLSGDKENEIQKCSRCMVETGGFYTALGCVPLNLSTFISQYILTTGIGIAGGIALLCILYSAFRMQTSMGNAEALKKAQENLTACITGLIIIIFSVLILKIIGVDILRIPGFQ